MCFLSPPCTHISLLYSGLVQSTHIAYLLSVMILWVYPIWRLYCESAVLNHFAIKALCTLRNNDWIQLLFRKVQNALITKWLNAALSQMSILTVGLSPDRGMRLNLPIAIVPLRRTDHWILDFQPPAAYVGDEQMLCILVRGRSVPTVTELIFVRAQCLTILILKNFALFGTITGSSYCSGKCKML